MAHRDTVIDWDVLKADHAEGNVMLGDLQTRVRLNTVHGDYNGELLFGFPGEAEAYGANLPPGERRYISRQLADELHSGISLYGRHLGRLREAELPGCKVLMIPLNNEQTMWLCGIAEAHVAILSEADEPTQEKEAEDLELKGDGEAEDLTGDNSEDNSEDDDTNPDEDEDPEPQAQARTRGRPRANAEASA